MLHMLDNGIIKSSNSPWASPVVMVGKKDGGLHFCVDFRQLDVAVIKDAHPLPCTKDLLDACWFSILNLKSRYGQVPIDESDKHKTTFTTSDGQLYNCNILPASWTMSFQGLTGRRVYLIYTILSSLQRPRGTSSEVGGCLYMHL